MTKSLHTIAMRQSDDPRAMLEAIDALNRLGIHFARTTRFQLKIGEWNFYPARGTITRDGCRAAELERGLAALLARVGAPPTKSIHQVSRNQFDAQQPIDNIEIVFADEPKKSP